MKKRTTVKDVAREAGVSVATVSYIMNDRKDVKISDETRKKVLQIANLLNYRPSTAAQTLATGKTNIIGITYIFSPENPSYNMEQSFYVNMLIEQLNRMHYSVIFIPTDSVNDTLSVTQNIDGIIAIDLPTDVFRDFSDKYMVPIVAVDMIVNDNLFYQVYSNIPDALSKYFSENPDGILVMERYSNTEYTDFVTSQIPADKLVIISNANRSEIEVLSGKKVIVIGTYLALLLRPYVPDENLTVISSHAFSHLLSENVTHLENDALKKANLAINLLLNAIDRKFVINHKHLIDIL